MNSVRWSKKAGRTQPYLSEMNVALWHLIPLIQRNVPRIQAIKGLMESLSGQSLPHFLSLEIQHNGYQAMSHVGMKFWLAFTVCSINSKL